MAAPRASLNSLNDDVLRRILIQLPQDDRMETVALVCGRWHRIMADPSIWPGVVVELEDDHFVGEYPHAGSMVKWLQQRGPGMRELTLRTQGFDTYMVRLALLHTAAAATQLQQLRIGTLPDADHVSVEDLACISVLCSLTSLEVSRISTPLGSPTLEDIFASLPALQSVCLGFCTNDLACATDSDSDAEGSQHLNCTRPDDFPHNLLRCTRLTSLELTMHHVDTYGTMFTVGGLPEGIAALQRLQHLRLYSCVTAPLTAGISRLTQLTSVEVLSDPYDEDVYDPGPMTALPTSLRVLEAHQVPAEVLMQLTALERLRVEEIGSRAGGSTYILSRLSALQRLTQLHLSRAGDEDLLAIAGCTGLRALCLDLLLEVDEPQPLPYPQLTRLQLRCSDLEMRDIMDMVSETPQLEVLEVLEQTETTIKLHQVDTDVLSQLREVNLSGSLLGNQSRARLILVPPQTENWPPYVFEQLQALERAVPRIEWVLRGAEDSSPWE